MYPERKMMFSMVSRAQNSKVLYSGIFAITILVVYHQEFWMLLVAAVGALTWIPLVRELAVAMGRWVFPTHDLPVLGPTLTATEPNISSGLVQRKVKALAAMFAGAILAARRVTCSTTGSRTETLQVGMTFLRDKLLTALIAGIYDISHTLRGIYPLSMASQKAAITRQLPAATLTWLGVSDGRMTSMAFCVDRFFANEGRAAAAAASPGIHGAIVSQLRWYGYG